MASMQGEGGEEDTDAEDNPEDETDEGAEYEAREEVETEEAEDDPQHAAVYWALVSVGPAPARCAALNGERPAARDKWEDTVCHELPRETNGQMAGSAEGRHRRLPPAASTGCGG